MMTWRPFPPRPQSVDLLDKRARRIYNLHAARFDLFTDIFIATRHAA